MQSRGDLTPYPYLLGGGLAIESILFTGACSRGDLNGRSISLEVFGGAGVVGTGGAGGVSTPDGCVKTLTFGVGIGGGAGFMGSYCDTKVKYCF